MSAKNSNQKIIDCLQEAVDRIEGRYSNIPECCVEEYITGKTFVDFHDSLSDKDKKKLSKWHYVPCQKCFKKNKINKLKRNGKSLKGKIISMLITLISEENNDRR